MGTIADKLTYLAGTKTAIKTAIEEAGVSVPTNTSFRQYRDYIAQIGESQADLEKDLVAHYLLNNDANDSYGWGGAESGTAYNGVAFEDDIVRGKSVAVFDGVNDYITPNNVIRTQVINQPPYCVSIWVFKSSSDTGAMVVYDADSTRFNINYNHYVAGKWSFDFYDGTERILVDHENHDDEWVHFVVQHTEDGDLQFWANGVMVDNVTGVNAIAANGTNIRIGAAIQNSQWFKGKLSDYRAYDRTLSTDEIIALYNETDIPAGGLVAHYPLTEEQIANDNWVGSDGTAYGNTLFTGDSARFDGATDYILCGSLNQINNNYVTVSSWLKFDNTMASGAFWGFGNDASTTQDLYYWPAQNVFGFNTWNSDSWGIPNASNVVADGKWHHVVAIINRSDIKASELYIDGVAQSLGQVYGTTLDRTPVTNFGIGLNGWNTGNQTTKGDISNLRVYNNAVSVDQILALYAEGRSPSTVSSYIKEPTTEALVAHYPLSGSADDIVGAGSNESGTGYNGLIFDDEGKDLFTRNTQVALFENNNYVTILSDGKNSRYDTQSFTLSAWVYVTNIYKDNVIFSYDYIGHSNPYYAIQVRVTNPGYVYFGSNNNAGSIVQTMTSDNSIKPYTWHHVVVTCEIGRQQIFIDNKLAGETTYGTGISYYNQEVWIGRGNWGGYFDGKMKDHRFYDRVLDTDEITGLYERSNETITSLVHHYAFAGNLIDSNGLNNALGGIDYTYEYGNDVAKFNGVDGYITLGGSTTVKERSIAMWIKKDSTTNRFVMGTSPMMSSSNTFGSWDILYYASQNIIHFVADKYNGSNYCRIGIPIDFEPNKWHHIVFTAKDNDLRGYINGQYVIPTLDEARTIATVSISNTVLARTNLTSANSTTSQYYFDGSIADVRVYNRAITADEVANIYDGISPPTAGLVSHYPLTQDWLYTDRWHSYNGSESSGVDYVEDPNFGSVMTRDDGTRNVSCPAITLKGDFSVSLWAKPGGAAYVRPISNASPRTYLRIVDNYNASFSFRSDDTPSMSTAANYTLSGGMQHFLMVRKGLDYFFYVDSYLVYRYTATAASDMTFTELLNDSADPRWAPQKLANVRFYNRALTGDDVYDIYNYERNIRNISVTEGLLSYWPLGDNGSDHYVAGADLTPSNTVSDGQTTFFNGINSRMTGNLAYDHANNKDFTVSAWVYMDSWNSVNSYSAVLNRSDNSTHYFSVFVSGNGASLGETGDMASWIFNTASNNIQHSSGYAGAGTGLKVTTGQWHHCVWVFKDGVGYTYYLDNGTPITHNTGVVSRTDNDHPITMGRWAGGSYYFDGKMSKVRFYDRAIEQNEVNLIYTSELGDFQ